MPKATPKTAPFDAADYLKTATARAEYITAALETNDPAFIRDAVGVVARSIGMSKVAKQAGVTREGLYKALGPSGNPEFGTVISLLPALQLKLSARPVRAKSAAKHVAHRRSRQRVKRRG
jgi:probable addiction module antidote protein